MSVFIGTGLTYVLVFTSLHECRIVLSEVVAVELVPTVLIDSF